MGLRLDVEKSLLEWAINRSDTSISELSKKSHFKKLGEWIDGTEKPTYSQLEEFSKATYTPFGYLLLPEPPQQQPLQIPHYRTMANRGSLKRSINHEDMIKVTIRRQDWIRDYLIDIGAAPLEFVGSSTIDDTPAKVADNIRKTLGITPEWTAKIEWNHITKRLEELMENARIFVSKNKVVQNYRSRQLDLEEFRGFVLVDDYAPFVFVNGYDDDGAQMFTLAHELAHIWMGESASFDLHDMKSSSHKLEVKCNKIAAEFLAPTDDVRRYWKRFNGVSNDPYKKLSKHFKISLIVAAIRARDTGCISQKEYGDFYSKYKDNLYMKEKKNHQKETGPPPDKWMPSRVGKRFLQTVFTAVAESKLLYRDAYHITGLSPNTFDKIRDTMGGPY